MNTSKIILAPYRQLLEYVSNIEQYVGFQNARWFMWNSDSLSWVYGLSEFEIKNFAQQFENLLQEIKVTIRNTENEKLKQKLNTEIDQIPSFDYSEYVLNTDNASWIFMKALRPFKTLRMTFKFKSILEDIRLTSERMINYTENQSWLELEK
ncbi:MULTISPECIES: hypothetical protein [unclassified Saccharicrinis]|uniref:hypothetical protein n=1 Tax=unclassified Saccharicrinis TaxID=2646859 RepID=UPI003D34ECE6